MDLKSITGLDNVHCAEQQLSCHAVTQPAEWLDGRADTRSPNLNTVTPERGWAHSASYYLYYAALYV